MKNHKCLLKKIGLLSLIFIVLLYLKITGCINLNSLADNHYNLITINSVFGGFLFTALATILSFSGHRTIRVLERTNRMDDIYSNIIHGITFGVAGITVSVFNSIYFIKGSIYINLKLHFYNIAFTLELALLIITVLSFMLSVKSLTTIIKSVRGGIKKSISDKENIK